MQKIYLHTVIVLGFALTLISCSKQEATLNSNNLNSSKNKSDQRVLEKESSQRILKNGDYQIVLENVVSDFKKNINWSKVNISKNNVIEYNGSSSSRIKLNEKIEKKLTPIVQSSENILLTSKFNKTVVLGLNNKEKILLAAIVKAHQMQMVINPDYLNIPLNNICLDCGGNLIKDNYTLNARASGEITGREVFECVMSAVGVASLVKGIRVGSLSSYAVRKALVRAVGKVAARIGLGAIGIALTVAEFGWCLINAADDYVQAQEDFEEIRTLPDTHTEVDLSDYLNNNGND